MFKEFKQRSLSQNKIATYLRYAAGEVILIVIGILIAVSIDNWNEEREQKKVLNGIFAVILNDIKQDTAEVNQLLDFYNKRKTTFVKITDHVLGESEIVECGLCPYLLSQRKLFVINKRGFYQLTEDKNNPSSNQDSLVFDIINFYTTLVGDVENFNDLIDNDVMENLAYWRDRYSWFPALMQAKLKKEDLGYFGGSQEYRNKVALHYILIYKNYIPILQTFQNDSREILKELDQRIKGEKR